MMKRLKNFLLIACLLPLFAMPAQAGAVWLENTLSQIVYLQAEDAHRTSYVWSGNFSALNGDRYRLSNFYRSHKPQFNAKTALRLFENKSLRLTMPLHFDNGFKADLYKARAYAGAGVTAQWRKTDRLILGFQLHDALKLGGRVTESPCHDKFRRAFHCGTGLPWRDATPHLRDRNVSTYGEFNVRWRF